MMAHRNFPEDRDGIRAGTHGHADTGAEDRSWFGSCVNLFACVHVPEFAAQALLRLRTNLQGQPVAVLEGAPPHERVCAANARARREGVANGMTRVEAESFAGLALLRRNAREEETARTTLLACAGSFTPRVEAMPPAHAAVCVLDIAGMARLYPDAQAFIVALRRALTARGLHASIAVSTNFHAACALAQGKPGLTVAAPGEEQEALAPLLLQVLALNEAQAQTLALWGIRTLGGLAALPQRQLIARMGQSGRQLREQARGEHPHLFTPTPVPLELREEFSFDAPVRLLEGILFVLTPMLDQLLLRAREHALAIATITLTFTLGARALDTEDDGRADAIDWKAQEAAGALSAADAPEYAGAAAMELVGSLPGERGPENSVVSVLPPALSPSSPLAGATYSRSIRPTLPTADRRLLLRLIELDLAAHPPASAVLSVVVEAEAATTGAVQAGLFAPPLPEPSRLDVTLARLSALVGEHRVGSPVLRNTHAPDSFNMRRFAGESSEAATTTFETHVPAMRQLRPGEPATVSTEAGKPVRFRFRGELYQVRIACGPWRSNGSWWNGDAWSIEVWDVGAEQARVKPASGPGFPVTRVAPAITGAAEAEPESRHEHDLVAGFLPMPEQKPAASSSAGEPAATKAPAINSLCCRLQRSVRPGMAEAIWSVEGLYD